MTHGISNAFTRSRKSRRTDQGFDQFPPLRARVDERPYGFETILSPMLATDAINVLNSLPNAGGHERSNLVFDAVPAIPGRVTVPDLSLREVSEGLRIDAEAFDDDHLLVNDNELAELLTAVEFATARIARFDGPVESLDASFINKAIASGQTPLDADLRVIASLQVAGVENMTLRTRSLEHAMTLIAENFRQYLSAVLNRSLDDLAAPANWQIERVLSVSGSLLVRPRETLIQSTSVDVGISTDPDEAQRPANVSLVYDMPSRTWHDEE